MTAALVGAVLLSGLACTDGRIAAADPEGPGPEEPGGSEAQEAVGAGPNAPSGYSEIFEWDMGHALPPTGGTAEDCDGWEGISPGGAGRMSFSRDPGDTSNYSLIDDPSAPVSGSRIQRVTWFTDDRLEQGLPPDLWLWTDETSCVIGNQTPHDYFSELYVSVWFRPWKESSPAEGNGKFGHLKKDDTKNVTFLTDNQGDLTHTTWGVKVRIVWVDNQGNTNTDLYFQPDRSHRLIRLNEWANVELQLVKNTLDGSGASNRDGILRVWVDGTLVMEHTDVSYGSGRGGNDGFFRWFDSHTYGTNQSKDFLDSPEGFEFDHRYLSGKK